MMRKSQYDSRARAINGKRFKEPPNTDISSQQYWQQHVKTPADVDRYFELYYPYYTKEIRAALVDYFTKMASGQISIPEHLRKEQTSSQNDTWDYKSEIAQQEIEGKIKLTEKRLSDLMNL